MSRSNSCMVCTYLIELVAGIMTGYIFIYLDDAIVMRFALSMLYIPAVLVLVDAKSKMVRFLVYLMLTAVCFWGVFYAIYWRRPFGFSLIFCCFIGEYYIVDKTDNGTENQRKAERSAPIDSVKHAPQADSGQYKVDKKTHRF